MTKKELFLASVRDAVGRLFFYDRKEDGELTIEDVNELIESGEITLAEIVEVFEDEIAAKYIEYEEDDE